MISPYGTGTHYVPNKCTNRAKRLIDRAIRALAQWCTPALGHVVLAAAAAAERAGRRKH
jgi:hypothetical protein